MITLQSAVGHCRAFITPNEPVTRKVYSYITAVYIALALVIWLVHPPRILPTLGDTLRALEARKWQQRVPIHFRPSELEEVGHELRSAARLIRDLDSGDLYPIRNATVMTCQGCRFREICDNPEDTEVVDALFDREPAKRYRDAA